MKHRYYLPLLAVGLLVGLQGKAQQRVSPGYFQEDGAARLAAQTSPLRALLTAARPLTLAAPALRTALTDPAAVLVLPLPNGRNARFSVREVPVMAPALAARYPSIRTYAGLGLDDPTATLRLDDTPQGIHAQVLSATLGVVCIDPVSSTDREHYLSYFVADRRADAPLAGCTAPPNLTGALAGHTSQRLLPAQTTAQQRASGSTLRTFRLAVATTDEYTAARGGTAASALASVVTTVNRVTGFYERELAIRLELVANNDLLIAANNSSRPDAYSNNNNPATALAENQAHLDAVIGTANYDLGHLFGTQNGGYAGIGIVCGTFNKAQAETGLSNPAGDGFDIQLVAHELGHQFGASHTFNALGAGACTILNRESGTAYEPGSGSTMMAYPGVCGSENIQTGRDAYFHGASHEQIQNYVFNFGACAVATGSGNTAPRVGGPASGKTMPVSTPFRLSATAFDAENDALTYCWEQMDVGTGAALTAPQVAGQTEPLFRSLVPSTSPVRHFPQLANLLANTTSIAEKLPAVAQRLRFRCVVRDAHNGPAGVVGGSDYSPTLTLNVSGTAGPFVLTAPNTAVSWPVGSTQTVTWDVAGTTANGVDCASVNLLLSADGGLTYPTLLLASTPNDGSQTIRVPNVPSAAARLMVAAADNYFFDISDRNFTISATPGAPLLTGISPGTGPGGITITLTGTGLGATAGVSVNGVAATFGNVTATSLTATVPLAAGTGPVVVSTGNGVSNGLQFNVLPTATSLTPSSGMATTNGLPGAVVTVDGSGLFGVIAVQFNGLDAPGFVVNTTGSQLTVTVPFGAQTGPVTVITGNGVVSPGVFTVLPTPCYTVTNMTLGTISTTSAVVNFSRSLGLPVSYTLTTVPATATYANFLPGGTVTGLNPNTLYTINLVTNCNMGRQTAPVSVSFITPPSGRNDECNTAVLLATGAPGDACVPTGGTLAGATQSMPPAWCSGTQALLARDVWYRFVATGPVHTVACSSLFFDGALEVFSGTCGNLNSLDCQDAVGRGTESLTLLSLVPGDTYWVRYYAKSPNPPAGYLAPCVTTPAPASATCPAPGGLVVSNITTTEAQVSFAPSGTATGYIISTIPRTSTYTTTATTLTLTGLLPGNRYVVSMASQCTGGTASAVPALAAFTTQLPDLVISTATIPTPRAYRNITVTSTGVASFGGPMQVTGTMLVESGGTFDENCKGLVGPGNFVLEPGATLSICNPLGISQSGPTGAIQVTGTRSFGTDAYFIYNVSGSASAGTGLPAVIKTLDVNGNPGSSLTLTNNIAVREAITLYSEANLYLGNANLLLMSDLSGTAYVANAPGRVINSGTGLATMQRYVRPTTAYTGPGYRHYSSPVMGARLSGLAVPGRYAPLTNPAYNALPTPALPIAQFPNVFRYTESRLTAAFPDFDTGWESPSGLTDSLAMGRGYTVNIAPAATVALSGRLNSGNLRTGPLGRASGPNGGWHLLGNPYPSALYFGSDVTDNLPVGLAHAIYVFEPSSRYGGFYRTFVNGISSDGTPCSLPAMQGFFIRATQPVPGGFTFQDAFRDYGVADAGSFHRSAAGVRPPQPRRTAPTWPTLRLALSGPTPAAGPADYVAVYLAPGARATGPDPTFDAVKLPNPNAGFSVAARMAGPGNDDLAIVALPPLPPAVVATHRIPLVLNTTVAGSYRFAISHHYFEPTQTLLLLDHTTGTTTNLRQQTSYAFTVAQAGTLAGRFELLLGTFNPLTVNSALASAQFSVWPNPVGRAATLRVALDKPTASATAVLRTVVGKAVAQRAFSGNSTELSTNGLAAGIYLLTVQAAGQVSVTRRVVVE